jgi:DNA polymerase II small subunit/DNA polymerase delta subunit B
VSRITHAVQTASLTPGSRLLGTAGQNVNDLFKYVEQAEESDRLRMAERTLEWGHVAPTAPDTLCEYRCLARACS